MDNKLRDFIVVLLANFFFFLNFSQLILLPKFIVHMGQDPVEIGLVMGIFNLAVIVALPIVGVISGKICRKYLFIAGAFVMGITTFAFVYIDNMGLSVYLLRILQGVSFSFAFGVSGVMVFDVVKGPDRNRFLGILTVSNITTHAIGPAIGEYAIASFGFDAYFVSASFFGILSTLIGVFLPRVRTQRPHHRILFRPMFPFVVASVILGGVFGATVIFLPPYLMDKGILNSTPFFISFVCGALMVWAFLYKVFGRIESATTWLITIVMMILLPLVAYSIKTLVSLIPLSLLFGIGYGYIYPTLNAATMEAYPSMKGMANAMFVWSFNMGMAFVSLAFGGISTIYGYGPAFIMLGIIGIFMVVLIRYFNRRIK
ncbi:MAG: MFS transporter [Deltaproteobacteria bacterium]|nr:MFS transporter [Deltaproteobacteria bacterium]